MVSAQSGISALAAGQCCADASNQQKTGDGEVCFNPPRALLLLALPWAAGAARAQGISVTSAQFVPLKNCPV